MLGLSLLGGRPIPSWKLVMPMLEYGSVREFEAGWKMGFCPALLKWSAVGCDMLILCRMPMVDGVNPVDEQAREEVFEEALSRSSWRYCVQ